MVLFDDLLKFILFVCSVKGKIFFVSYGSILPNHHTFIKMKTKTNSLLVLASILAITSCQNKKQEIEGTSEKQIAEKPVAIECYQAIYERDTINLQVEKFNGCKIGGNMQMQFDKMPLKKGAISGEFSGDTLFVSYTFIEGTNEKITFKNPMAFLKRGDQLILGNGKMQTTMGATYFVKGEPIDFDSVKFKFDTIVCE